MKTRRGVSLIELLVVLSASTVILTMSAALVHRVMHIYSQARAFHNVERNTLRLSEQFRRDGHQAMAATALDGSRNDGVFLRLQLADGQTLEYREVSGSVSRTRSQGDKTLSRDAFTFPPNIKLSLREDGRPRRLILSITAAPVETPDMNGKSPWTAHSQRVNLQAEVVLGRDGRFATTSNTEPLR
jgi:prepilin-type N-terminal cleavage/methylation domain-containing protein